MKTLQIEEQIEIRKSISEMENKMRKIQRSNEEISAKATQNTAEIEQILCDTDKLKEDLGLNVVEIAEEELPF